MGSWELETLVHARASALPEDSRQGLALGALVAWEVNIPEYVDKIKKITDFIINRYNDAWRNLLEGRWETPLQHKIPDH